MQQHNRQARSLRLPATKTPSRKAAPPPDRVEEADGWPAPVVGTLHAFLYCLPMLAVIGVVRENLPGSTRAGTSGPAAVAAAEPTDLPWCPVFRERSR